MTEEAPARLFDVPDDVTPTGAERLSADRRRTIRRQQAIAAGRHPLRLDPLLTTVDGATCGTCTYLVARGHNLRNYWKCGLYPHEITSGAGTDVRVSWPACNRWQPSNPTEGTP